MKKLYIIILLFTLVGLFTSPKTHAQTWSSVGSGGPAGGLMAVYNGELYATGQLNVVPFGYGLNKWDGKNWSQVGTVSYPNSNCQCCTYGVLALLVYDGSLLIGGNFSAVNNLPDTCLASWDGNSWHAFPGSFTNEMALSIGTDSVGGLYADINYCDSGRDYLEAGAYEPGLVSTFPYGGVTAYCLYNNEFYIANYGGVYGFDFESLISVGGGGPMGTVGALAVFNNELYSAGNFTTSNDSGTIITTNNIAKWNGAHWSAVGTGLGGDGCEFCPPVVQAMTVYNGALYVAGSFTAAGADSTHYIAKWDGASWSSLGSGVNGAVSALAVCNNELYASGNFTTAGGISANGIARWGYCSANFSLRADPNQLHHYIAANNSTGQGNLSYVWSWGDGTYDSIPYPTHTYADTGFYTICLTITDSTGCQSSFCNSSFHAMRTTNSMAYITVVNPNITTDVNAIEQAGSALSIYPNPVTNQLAVHSSYTGSAVISIINVLGQDVSTTLNAFSPLSEVEVDVSRLSAGIYFIQLKSESGSAAKMFVKE